MIFEKKKNHFPSEKKRKENGPTVQTHKETKTCLDVLLLLFGLLFFCHFGHNFYWLFFRKTHLFSVAFFFAVQLPAASHGRFFFLSFSSTLETPSDRSFFFYRVLPGSYRICCFHRALPWFVGLYRVFFVMDDDGGGWFTPAPAWNGSRELEPASKKKKKCRPPTDSSAMIERIARRLILGITLVFLAIFIFYSCLLPSEFESSLNRLLSERRRWLARKEFRVAVWFHLFFFYRFSSSSMERRRTGTTLLTFFTSTFFICLMERYLFFFILQFQARLRCISITVFRW